MAITENAKAYHEKLFPGMVSQLAQTDPEFIERFDNFAFDEVLHQPRQGLDDEALLIRVVSQCLPYIGYPRSLNALSCVDAAAEGMEKHD